jgi:hypothetical protein
MRVLKIAAVSLGLALASPGLAIAQEALAGAITGALTGGLAGGPIGAAIGGLAGAAIGGAAEANHARWQSVRPVADLGSAIPSSRIPDPLVQGTLPSERQRARQTRQKGIRSGLHEPGMTQAYSPPQRTTEPYPRRIARTHSHLRAVPVQPARVSHPQLASAVSVMERTCVRDRAGNQTCREVIR